MAMTTAETGSASLGNNDPTSTDLVRYSDADVAVPALSPEPLLTSATVVPDRTRTFGTLVFLVADAMFLAGLVAAYFAIKHGSAAWPPVGVSVGTYVATTVTITAFMSAFSAQWAVFAIRGNDQRNAAVALALTVFLGVASINAEIQELSRVGFGIGDHAYGTFYYLFFSYHIAHLMVGIGLLTLLAGRSVAGHFSNEHHDPLRAGVVFWHYTNAAWFLIVTVLLIFSRHS